MGINNTQTAYSFGQLGSLYLADTNLAQAPTGKVFVAITVVDDCEFQALTAASDAAGSGSEYIGTTAAYSSAGGDAIPNDAVFQAGLTIYGRWTSVDLASGRIIAYIGD